MSTLLKIFITSLCTFTLLQANETLPVANNFDELFSKGKISGQIEAMYTGHDIENNEDPYSTGIGGQLKYETAILDGFNAGFEFTTVHEIDGISGDTQEKRASILVSPDGSYTELSQSYINYNHENLNFRIGRQLIDTPLADSDDFRIIDNTFEAAIASYETSELLFMLGYLDRWQGTDAGLDKDEPWQETGRNGTYFGGVSYAWHLFDAYAWYYDISGSLGDQTANRSTYVDARLHLNINKDLSLHTSAQYLKQSENDRSNIDADLYGLMLDVSVYTDLSLFLAYNKRVADDTKTSFAGFGGGVLYTNMANMLIDAMVGGDAEATVAGITYIMSNFSVYYIYGMFDRDQTAILVKEEIIEHNIGAHYNFNKNLMFSAILTIDDNKENTDSNAMYTGGDFKNLVVSLAYTF